MDPITHPLTGVIFGAGVARNRQLLWPLVLTGFLAAQLPDFESPVLYLMDLIASGGEDKYYFKTYHRIYTHTVFAAPLLALIGAAPAWLWVRGRYLFFYLVAMGNVLMHLLLDWCCQWDLYLIWPIGGKTYNFSNGWPLLSLDVGDTYVPLLVMVLLLAPVAIFIRSNQKDSENEDVDE